MSIRSGRCGRTVPVVEIPEPVDLAFLAVPAAHVLEAARQCAEKGVKALVVISAGFSETDAAGRQQEAELLRIVRAAGMHMVGPNCFGVFNTDPRCGFNGTFSPLAPQRGNVAVCTQSGAIGVVIPDFARPWSLGISSFVSMGNKAELAEETLLPWWEDDPATDVIALYLESIRDPHVLLSTARRISRRKPIVAIKAGRSAAGSRAVGSHTAALAGSSTAADALLRQAGIIHVADLQELFETTALLASQPLPRGNRVGIVSNAGGPAILCADGLESRGMQVPEFSAALQTALRNSLHMAASLRNPIDLMASVDPADFRTCVESLMGSEEVDAVIVLYVPRLSGTTPNIARAVGDAARQSPRQKPVLAVWMDAQVSSTTRDSPEHGIPAYLFPESAARALSHAYWYSQWSSKAKGQAIVFTDTRADEARRVVLQRLKQATADGVWLSAEDTAAVLDAFQIPTPGWEIADSPDAAVAAASRLGGIVALKALAPGLIHKAAAGGVLLSLHGEHAVRDAYEQLVELFAPSRRVLVQQFIPGGHEVLIGVTRDATFGHLIAFGAGGSATEAVRDVAFRLHPLTDRDALELMLDTRTVRSWEQLGSGGLELTALRTVLLRVSSLIDAVPEIAELDLNPVKVIFLANENGIVAVDTRIRISI